MVLAGNRFGSIDTEENGVLTEEVPTARDVAGFAADIMLDEERFDEADVNDCARCARARDGKLASKTTNGTNRPQKRNIGATAKRTERMLGRRALLRNTGQFVGVFVPEPASPASTCRGPNQYF
jgi:hypothetical protein